MVDFVKAPPGPREGYKVEKEWQEYLDVVHRNFVREAYGPDFVFPRKILDLEQAVREDWFENYPFKEQAADKAKRDALNNAYLDLFDKNFEPKRLEQAWQATLQNYRNYQVKEKIAGRGNPRAVDRFVFPREILDAEDKLREIFMQGRTRSKTDKEKAENALLDLYDKLVDTEDALNLEMRWQNVLQESNHRGLVESTYGLGEKFVYPKEVLDAEENLRDVLYSLRFRDASKALSQAYKKVVYGVGIRRTDDL